MAQSYALHLSRKNSKQNSLVKVSGLGMQRRTLVGNAVKHFESDSHVFVGAEAAPGKTESEKISEAPPSESKQIAHKIKDNLGETASKFVLGSMVFGPPVVGGLLWGGTGLLIGGMIASPFVLVFVWSVIL